MDDIPYMMENKIQVGNHQPETIVTWYMHLKINVRCKISLCLTYLPHPLAGEAIIAGLNQCVTGRARLENLHQAAFQAAFPIVVS